MRLRICRQPTRQLDGARLRHYHVGVVYDVSPQLAEVFLAQEWAERVSEELPVRAARAPVVLIVDDEPDLRKLAASVLLGGGYDVVEASHGQEGLTQLRSHAPDLVLLDLQMPVMDGWQFRAEQQALEDARLARIPVVLFSSVWPIPVYALKAMDAIVKPFAPEELLRVVDRALESAST